MTCPGQFVVHLADVSMLRVLWVKQNMSLLISLIEPPAVGCGLVLHEALPVDSMSGVGRVRTTSSVSGVSVLWHSSGDLCTVCCPTPPMGTASFCGMYLY